MFTKKLVLMLGLALAGTGTVLADAHKITYSRKEAAVGTTITVGGVDFEIVRIPFRLFTGERYYLQAPARVFGPFGTYIAIETTHDNVFTPNGTIDSRPAQISVRDARTYSLGGEIGAGLQFRVTGGVNVDVTIKVGTNTLVSLQSVFIPSNSSGIETEVLAAHNAVPYAQWAKYTDPVQGIKAANDMIDYIRIVAIP